MEKKPYILGDYGNVHVRRMVDTLKHRTGVPVTFEAYVWDGDKGVLDHVYLELKVGAHMCAYVVLKKDLEEREDYSVKVVNHILQALENKMTDYLIRLGAQANP